MWRDNEGNPTRRDYVPAHNAGNLTPMEQNYDFDTCKRGEKIGKWKRLCGYLSIVPIFILLVIVIITIFSTTGDTSHKNFLRFKANKARRISSVNSDGNNKCQIQLVESIPVGLTYPDSEPKFLSTIAAWNTLLDLTKKSLNMGTFYWTMRGIDVVNHTTAAPGEAIFSRILSNKLNKQWNVRIAQSIPTDPRNAWDTELLTKEGAATVRLVDFPRLLGGGVLHTKLWIADQQHFYLGSANMDWRSLTQVKELGVLAQNCPSLARDLNKIFEAYWYLGATQAEIPNPWPAEYATNINLEQPLQVEFNEQYKMSVFFSSSPPPFLAAGRTNDLDAIINTILTAKRFVHIAVMDYFPLMIYVHPYKYWPFIDDALRKAAVENRVSIKLLISWWEHSNPSEDYFLRSLLELTHAFGEKQTVDIEVKRFIVPMDEDQQRIPFGRVNHNKYLVTDNVAYIGTSNWSGDYFTNTAGIGFILKDDELNAQQNSTTPTLRAQLASVFMRDWNSPYSIDQPKIFF